MSKKLKVGKYMFNVDILEKVEHKIKIVLFTQRWKFY